MGNTAKIRHRRRRRVRAGAWRSVVLARYPEFATDFFPLRRKGRTIYWQGREGAMLAITPSGLEPWYRGTQVPEHPGTHVPRDRDV
jgi:hypothetical protein